MRHRSRPNRTDGPVADLPPARIARWAAWTTALVALLTVSAGLAVLAPDWLVNVRTGALIGRGTTLLAATVVVAVFASYSIWRLRVEQLAARPGPIMVLPFVDNARHGARPTLALELKAVFEEHLVATALYGPTAVPSTTAPSDFLRVVEAAGDQLRGTWAAASRFVRLFAPVTAHQLTCTLQTGEGREPFLVVVELSRLPRTSLAPFTVQGATWDEAVERAAHAVASVVLPRTRQCGQAPWSVWAGYRIPVELFHDYQRFLTLRSERYYDEAVAALRRALRRDPGNLAMRLELGKMQERQQMYLDALLTYDDIVTVAAHHDPHLAAWWSPRGIDYRPTWSLASGARGLSADDSVVLVARYRHGMLLGLGEKIAGQWWARPERCVVGRHRSAREERRAHLRGALRHRFLRRHQQHLGHDPRRGDLGPPWLGDLVPDLAEDQRRDLAAAARVFFTTVAQLEFERLADDFVRLGRWPRLRRLSGRAPVPDIASFAGWRRVPALRRRSTDRELRIARRSGRLATPDSEDVLPREAILMSLPWSSLRRAMAHAHAIARGVGHAPPHGHPAPDGCSLLAMSVGATVALFPLARELLGGPWPVDPAKVEDVVARLTGRPEAVPRTWRAHFNAACVLALPMLAPDGRAWLRDEHPDVVGRAARGAVAELHRAVACADSDYLSRQRDWLLAEEPDLDQLRGRGEFKDFEATTYGSIGAAVQRGPDIHLWRQTTYVNQFIHAAAREMADLWERRQRGRIAGDTDRARWLDEEMAAWRLAERLATDARDSGTRQDVAQQIATAGRLPGLRRPRVRHPRFSNLVLDRQLISMQGGGDIDLLSTHRERRVEAVAERIGDAIETADDRLERLADSLRRGRLACCSLGREPVLTDEEGVLRAWSRSLVIMSPEAEQRWCRTSSRRWSALADWFDDETFASRTLPERRDAFHLAIRTRWWDDGQGRRPGSS